MNTCKNCGAQFDSNFCPDCGQKATVGERLTLKAYSRHFLFSFARLNDGFINTAVGLVRHPWRVISDSIHGKRVRFSPPVTMLIQVILYTSVLVYILEEISGLDLEFNDTPYLSIDVGHWFVDFLLSSDIFQDIIMIIPASLAGMIAFRWVGGRRYNAAEYLVAGTYMMCLNFIIQFLAVPIQLMADGSTFGIPQIVFALYILLTLWRAFPAARWWSRGISILLYLIVALVFILLEFVIIGGIAVGFAYLFTDGIQMGFNLH